MSPSMASGSRPSRNAAAIVDASLWLVATGSRTKGNAQGRPRIARAASWMRAGAT